MATFLDLIVTGPTCATGAINGITTSGTMGFIGNIDWTRIINKVYASSTADGIMTKADFTKIQNWKNNDLKTYSAWIGSETANPGVDWNSESNKYNHWP